MNRQLPVHKGHWLWKSVPEMSSNIKGFITELHEKYGDTFILELPLNHKTIITSNPDFIKHVLLADHTKFKKNRTYDQLKLILGEGLVTSNGDFWRQQRRLIQPTFYKKNLIELFNVMVGVAEEYCTELDKKRNTTIDMAQEMMIVTARIALKSLFSTQQADSEQMKTIYDSMTIVQRYSTSRMQNPLLIAFAKVTPSYYAYQKNMVNLHEIIEEAIEQRRKTDQQYPDLLQMLMDSTYEDTNEQMDVQQLRDELITMFSAGHETSANGLAWLWYLLSTNPSVVKKLKAEAATVLNGTTPTFESMRQLQYHKQVIEEGMRIYPPVWSVSRQSLQAGEHDGIAYEEGASIMCTIFQVHKTPEIWENPMKFDPDRFSPEKVKARPKAHYMPFALGPRMCIGNHFAMMEMQLILVMMVQRYDFQLVDKRQIEEEALVTLRPKHGIRMSIR